MAIYGAVKKSTILDTFESGGKLDAFRHTYAMAYLARGIKIKKLKKLGLAHENGNKRQFKQHKLEQGERADSLACEMDLRNNQIGLDLGKNHTSMSDEDLKQLILNEILNGTTWYLKRNKQNHYVTCDDKEINFDYYKERWFVPKCLIKTNE